jgi:hypothetical protein
MTKRTFCTSLLIALQLASGAPAFGALRARADAVPLLRADALFEQGKSRMAAGDLERGCADLAESFRIEAATGSLLALALCHEKQQKNLSALVEYREVLARSERDGRPDRARAAQLKVLTLETKIPSVRIDVPKDRSVDGLVVKLNGTVLRPDQLGTAIAVDGPSVLVEATSARHQTWRSSFPVAEDHQVVALMLPDLENLPPAGSGSAPAPASARSASSPSREPSGPRFPHIARVSSLTVAGVGVGVLIASGALTLRAAKLDDRSGARCDGNLCTQEGKDLRLDARSAGTAATITGVAGAVLAGAGLVTYFVLRRNSPPSERNPRLQASAFVHQGSAGAVIGGTF